MAGGCSGDIDVVILAVVMLLLFDALRLNEARKSAATLSRKLASFAWWTASDVEGPKDRLLTFGLDFGFGSRDLSRDLLFLDSDFKLLSRMILRR